MRLSDIMNDGKPKRVFRSFSVVSSSPVNYESVPIKLNFSENPDAAKEFYEITNFSLLERIRLNKLSPRQILRRRVNEVVRYLRGNNLDNISSNKEVLLQYLNEYIYSIIVKLMNDPKITQINLILVLGLPAILKDLQSVRNLQRFLLRTKREINQKGYIPRILQNKLSKYYTEFWEEFLKSLESRYLTGEKIGVLSGRKELDGVKLPLAVQFSKTNNEFVNKVEDIIYNMMDKEDVDYSQLFDLLDHNKLSIDKKVFILDDEDLSKVIYDYLNNHNKKKLSEYLDKATLKTVKVNFSSITDFAEVPSVDPNMMNQQTVDPNTGAPISPPVQPTVPQQVGTVDPNIMNQQMMDPNMNQQIPSDPNLGQVPQQVSTVDPNMMNQQMMDPNLGQMVIDPATQQAMLEQQNGLVEDTDHKVLIENDEYKVGAIKGPKYNAAYVAFSTKTGYKARIYKLSNNSMKVDFAELAKLPCKSVKINSISEISNYL